MQNLIKFWRVHAISLCDNEKIVLREKIKIRAFNHYSKLKKKEKRPRLQNHDFATVHENLPFFVFSISLQHPNVISNLAPRRQPSALVEIVEKEVGFVL